jgi:peptidoglycan/LPS O-acetylase OafA/YrhL
MSGSAARVRPDIQGLRGLAVLLVVGYHTGGVIPGGFIGVDVFFVVSGFVITGVVSREAAARSTLDLRAFFGRRIRRLLPMLALTLTVTSVLGVFLLSPLGASETTGSTAVAAALLNANTFLQRQAQDYFALPADANALLHTWSLSVEEQFYLCFPFVVLAGLAVRRRVGSIGRSTTPSIGRSTAAALALLLAGASFAAYALLLDGRFDGLVRRIGFSSAEAVAFYSAPTRAWEFLAGAALALVAHRVERLPAAARLAAGVVGLVLVVGTALGFTEADGMSAPAMTLPVVGAVLLLAAGTAAATPALSATAALSIRPATWVGDRSYGWYLFHWPLIVFAAANFASPYVQAAAAVVSLPLASLAKRLLEDPLRYSRRLQGRRLAGFGMACVAVPVAVGALSVLGARAIANDSLRDANAQHVDTTWCNRRQEAPLPLDASECTWPADGPSRGRIVLIGDSHASMWSEAVIGAGNELGYDVSIATMSGCPVFGGPALRDRDGEPDTDCREFADRSIRELVELRPDLVLVAAASQGLLTGEGEDSRWTRPDGSWTERPDEIAQLYGAGLAELVDELDSAGVPTTVIHDVPYHAFTNAKCSWLRDRLSATGCASVRTRSEAHDELAASRQPELAAVEGSPLATTLDPLPWLCDGSQCATFGRDTWLYRDRDHLSVPAARLLVPEMRRALEERLQAQP